MTITIPTDFHIGKLDSVTAQLVISLIVGSIAPWIIAFFNKQHFSDKRRVVVAIIISIILGIAQCAATGQFENLTTLVMVCMVIWQRSQVVYKDVALKFGIKQFEINTTGMSDHDVENISPVISTRTYTEDEVQRMILQATRKQDGDE